MASQRHSTRPTTPEDVIDGLSGNDPNVSISGTILEWITASGFEGGGGGEGGGDLVNNSVTNAFLANMPQATIKGRETGAGTGDPTDLTAIQVRTILNVQSGATANSTDAQLRDRTTHTGLQTTSTITGLDASLGLLAPIANPTFTGTPAAPTALPGANTTQLATTAFVEARAQAISSGLSFKNSVRVATTANGTFASAFDNGSTIDGVVLATGNRILIKNQSSQAENGIYTVNASGSPTRGTDTDTWTEIVSAFCFVEEGTANADTSWVCNVNTGGTINTTAVTFVQFAGTASAVSDGDKGDVTVSGSGTVWTVDVNAITTAKILDANVTTAKIADANITTAKILDANVTAGKLASDSVITAKILDANVTTAKIADSSVTTAKIADANVTTTKILDANVTTAKILDANITAAKIADGNVTAAKIPDDAITYAKVQNVSAASRLLGRGSDNGSGDVEEISFGDGLELIGTVLSSTVEGGIPEITPDSITNTFLSDMPEATIKGRAAAAGTGDPADLTAAQVRAIINVQDGANTNSTDAQLRDRTTHTGVQATSTITGLDASLALLAPIASPTFTGVPSAPTAAPGADTTQLATTAFVEARAQAIASGLSFKNSVRAATTTNGTLASAFDNASIIDGVTLITGDRILLKNQSTPAENGIYTVAASGAPVRGTDSDTWAELVSAFCFVEEGTINADTSWVCNVNAGGTINVTSVTFVQFAGTTSAIADGDKGDVTVSGSGTVWTIDPSAVTTTKILDANVTAGKLASDAVTTVKILDANVTTAKVANDAITYAKIQNIAGASRLLGRGSIGGSGDVEEILLGAGLSLAGITLSSTVGSGVSGTPNPSTIATGTISTALSSTEVQLGSSITITPSSTSAKIQIWAWAHATKDTGTTVRVMSIRVRNGTTNGSTQVGSDVTASSAAIASTKYGGAVPGFVHSPASVAAQTYTVRAVIGAGASTATNYAIAAVEIGSGGFDIAGLTEDTTPDGTADFLVIRNTSGSSYNKVLIDNLYFSMANGATGFAQRTIKSKLGEFISVKDFQATGNGTTDDTVAIQAALDYCRDNGRDLFFPKGIYRTTARLVVGSLIFGTGTTFSDAIDLMLSDEGEQSGAWFATNFTDAAVRAASTAYYTPSLEGEAGSIIWADWTSATRDAIIYHGGYLVSSQPSESRAAVRNLEIVGKAGYASPGGAKQGIGDGITFPTDNLVGLLCERGCRLVENVQFRCVEVGLLAENSYWCRFNGMSFRNCEVAARFIGGNAVKIDSALMFYCNRGLIYCGGGGSIFNINSQNCVEDLIIPATQNLVVIGGYLEDTDTNANRTGKFSIRLGETAEGNDNLNLTIIGLRTDTATANKKGIRIWGSRSATFLGTTIDNSHTIDAISAGMWAGTDSTISEDQFPLFQGSFEGKIKTENHSHGMKDFIAGMLTAMNFGASLVAGGTANVTRAVTGITTNHIVLLGTQTALGGLVLSAKCTAVDVITVYAVNATEGTLNASNIAADFTAWSRTAAAQYAS